MFSASLSMLVACALVQASSGFEISGRYFDMPLKASDMRGGNFDHYLIRNLKLGSDTSPAAILEQLKQIGRSPNVFSGASSFGSDSPSQDFFKASYLRELADGSEQCSLDLADNFLTAYQAYKATSSESNHADAMLNYLEHFGRAKFTACAPMSVGALKKEVDFYFHLYRQAERFFKLALSLDGAPDEKLYEALKQFKPLESSYNVNKLAQFSERAGIHVNAAGRIKAKFDTICQSVFKISDSELTNVNLANLFAPEAQYFEKNLDLGKLNEMNRICLEAYDKDELLRHLDRFCKPHHDRAYPSRFAAFLNS